MVSPDSSLNTKRGASALPAQLVERHALIARLDHARAGRVSILQAPAGYGKSVLLRAWARKLKQDAVDVAFVETDQVLSDPGLFILAVFSAVANLGSLPGDAPGDLHELSNLSPRSAARRVAHLLRHRETPLVIFVDNYTQVSHDEMDSVFGELLKNLEGHVHFCVASRTQLRIPLGELWLGSNATELSAADLRLTDEEIAQLFKHTLDTDSLARISVWTEGWPVAVSLAHHHLSTRDNDDRSLSQLLTGRSSNIGRYLMDQVVQSLSESHRELLIQSSFLDPLCEELVEAVTGIEDTRLILQDLERSNLLLSPLGDAGTWYRCHHLLREVLFGELQRRGQRELARLQILASRWYEGNSNLREAIRHARAASDFHRIAQLILQAGGIFYGARYGARALRTILEQLPPEFVIDYSRVNLAWVIVLYKEGSVDAAADIISAVRHRLALVDQERPDAIDPLLLRDLAFAELSQAAYCGAYVRPEQLAIIERAAADASAKDYWLRGLLNNLLSMAQHRQAELPLALATGKSAHYYYVQAGLPHGIAHIQMSLGMIHLDLADTHAAIEQYRAARASFASEEYTDTAGCAMADLLLAEALYEQGEFSEARALCGPALACVEKGESYYELFLVGYRTATALALADEGPQAAARVLRQALAFIRRRRYVEVERYLLLRRLELELEVDEQSGVEIWAALSPTSSNDDGARICSAERDLKAIVEVRQLLKRGDLVQGLECLSELQRSLVAQGRIRSLIVALVEEALARDLSGNRLAAADVLRKAIALALPGSLLRPFFECGQILMPLLVQLTTGNGLCNADPVESAFVVKLIRICNDLNAMDACLFSPRELEIMRLLAQEMHNKVIARTLGVSPDTVRFHLKKIYEKLGVSDRRLAVDLVQSRNLLG
jgi:LuxR family transcriptional regulator, maltose regulon positive regulatory protein